MKYLKIFMALIMVISLALSAQAKPKKDTGSAKSKSAGERITDHTADAVADVLTGEDSSPDKKTKKVPPGHAKKGTTPHGWSQGEKTGWDKEESGTKTDSPIKQMVRKLFGKE